MAIRHIYGLDNPAKLLRWYLHEKLWKVFVIVACCCFTSRPFPIQDPPLRLLSQVCVFQLIYGFKLSIF